MDHELSLGNLLYCIQRQIHKPVFFFEIRHRSTDGDFGCELLLIGFQAFCPEVGFSLHLYGNNLFVSIPPNHKKYNELPYPNYIFYSELLLCSYIFYNELGKCAF